MRRKIGVWLAGTGMVLGMMLALSMWVGAPGVRAARSPTPTPTPLLSSIAPPANTQYTAYIPAATKGNQAYHYSCEFDAAWVILQTYGISSTVDDLIGLVGQDRRVEPYYKQTPQGLFIYGGDIATSFSGNYRTNFLARSTGAAMRKVFEHYGLRATPVNTRAGVEAALRGGSLVWIKTTADFKPGRRATWVMPDARKVQTVFSNDHAVVVMGYNASGVVIRDVLGPTGTNPQRRYEYLVPWATFLSVWGQQAYDGLAVVRQRR